MRRKQKRIVAGAVAGFIGGVIGSFVMNEFQEIASEIARKQQPKQQQSQEESEDATMKTADKVSQAVLHRGLSKDEKKKAGPVVHYAFGGSMGALYGALSAVLPETTAGFGTAFATALFAVADEVAVPALGLSAPPTQTPLAGHAKALASHLVWGTTTEAVRRIAA